MVGDKEYLDQETSKQRRQREVRDAKPVWWSYLAIFLSCLTLSVLGFVVSIKYADANARKWCEIVITMDDAYHQPRPPGSPPLTSTGKKLAEDMSRLRKSLACHK